LANQNTRNAIAANAADRTNAMRGPRNCDSSADRKPASPSVPGAPSRATKDGTFSLQPLKQRYASLNARGTVRKPAAIERQKAK
jgi:hypothetical protein